MRCGCSSGRAFPALSPLRYLLRIVNKNAGQMPAPNRELIAVNGTPMVPNVFRHFMCDFCHVIHSSWVCLRACPLWFGRWVDHSGSGSVRSSRGSGRLPKELECREAASGPPRSRSLLVAFTSRGSEWAGGGSWRGVFRGVAGGSAPRIIRVQAWICALTVLHSPIVWRGRSGVRCFGIDRRPFQVNAGPFSLMYGGDHHGRSTDPTSADRLG